MSSSQQIGQRRNLLCIVASTLACLAGCSVLRMYEPLRLMPGDWIQDGGNPQRTNVAQYVVRPPFVRAWEYDAGAGFANASAAVAESLVFVGTLRGELHVIRIGTGRRVGSTDLGVAIAGTPTLSSDVVYVPLTRSEENLIAFNLQRAGTDWRLKVGDIETSPLLIDNRLYVTTMQGELVCVNRVDGAVAWKFRIPGERLKAIRSAPAADKGSVFFGADDGNVYAVGQRDGKLLWTYRTNGSILATPSVRDGKVFVGSTDKTVYCLDADSGALVWKHDMGSRLYGSQAVGGEHVFVGGADGSVRCLVSSSGRVLWSFQAQSVVSAGLLLCGEILYVGALDRHLYALDAGTGKVLWTEEFPSRIKAPPVAWGDFLIVLLEDHSVVGLRTQQGDAQ